MWNIFKSSFIGKKAPAIQGDLWMNVSSLPQSIRAVAVEQKELTFEEELRNKVVILFFWDYTDHASLADIPMMHDLWERYEGEGFLIIGVHTPQLEYATDSDKVQGALIRFDLDFPVINDASYATWKRYGCTKWPRKIVIDAHGIIRADIEGEGGFETLEPMIRELLNRVRKNSVLPESHDVDKTSDIMFGVDSAVRESIALSPSNQPAEYHLQYKIPLHHFGLSGWWIIQKNSIVNGPISDDQACVVHFLGTAVTLGASAQGDGMMEVILDSKPIPERIRGRDILLKDGKTFVSISEDRGYSLVVGATPGKHMLSIIPAKGEIHIEACLFSV